MQGIEDPGTDVIDPVRRIEKGLFKAKLLDGYMPNDLSFEPTKGLLRFKDQYVLVASRVIFIPDDRIDSIKEDIIDKTAFGTEVQIIDEITVFGVLAVPFYEEERTNDDQAYFR
jgi:hypothetical protein